MGKNIRTAKTHIRDLVDAYIGMELTPKDYRVGLRIARVTYRLSISQLRKIENWAMSDLSGY